MNRIDKLIQNLRPDGVVYKDLGDLLERVNGSNKKIVKSKITPEGKYPVYTQGASQKPDGFSNESDALITDVPVILYGDHTNALKWIDHEFIAGADGVKLIKSSPQSGLMDKFLYHCLREGIKQIPDGYARHFAKLRKLPIPIPPLEVQKEIVNILDKFTQWETELEAELETELETRKQQYEHYRNELLTFGSGTPIRELWEVTIWDKLFSGVDRTMQPKIIKYPYVLAGVFREIRDVSGDVRLLSTGISDEIIMTTEAKAGKNLCDGEVVAIPWGGTPNVKYHKGKFVTADNRIATSNDTTVLVNKFLYYFLQNNMALLASYYRGSGIKHPSMKRVLTTRIPIPSVDEQNRIVTILDKFDALVSDMSAALPAELIARRRQYEYYRGKLLTFPEKQKEATHVRAS